MLYVFDVDGTLVEPAKRMPPEFSARFSAWAKGRRYFLVSGSTLEKMDEQVPFPIMSNAEGWFPCLGNERWYRGSLVSTDKVYWPRELNTTLLQFVDRSVFTPKDEPHIEDRGAMLCFAVPGRKADDDTRRRYAEFDRMYNERRYIVTELSHRFTRFTATIGGQISIDLSMRGYDKSQVLKFIRQYSEEPITFFADKGYKGGNDFPLACALEAENRGNVVIHVNKPADTELAMKHIEEDGL